jgi:ABC-type phosphate/phosphonate transport system ATPase subunit
MLELLGVGVPRPDGGWLLHRVCARFERAEVVAVVSGRPEERKTLLDAIAGRVATSEGRVWVDGVPSMRGTGGRLRQLVGEVELPTLLVPHRSILWNVLAHRPARPHVLGSLQRLPGLARRGAAIRALRLVDLDGRLTDLASTLDPEAAARLSLARALLPGPRYLVIREPDHSLGGTDLAPLLARVGVLARLERLTALVSLSRPDAASHPVGRILALADGLLVFDGSPAAFARSGRWPATYGATRAAPAGE